MGDHVYEPVAPADQASTAVNRTAKAKDESRHFLRIPLTEELVMADDMGSEPETSDKRRKRSEEVDDDDDEEDEEEEEEDEEEEYEEDEADNRQKKSDESIYEGENENSSVGEGDRAGSSTRMKAFQQKVKVKADLLRTKLQGVTKRKPKQKIALDSEGPNGEKSRRKFGQFATLPKKFTFNAPKVNFSAAFEKFSHRNTGQTDEGTPVDGKDEAKAGGGRFSLPRFGFARTSSESPKPVKSLRIGASRVSIPNFRSRAWSDASKVSSKTTEDSGSKQTRFGLDYFGTYPRIFSKRRKSGTEKDSKTPSPPTPKRSLSLRLSNGRSENSETEPPAAGSGSGGGGKRKESFRRRFFRSHHKESTPAPTDERTGRTATLAVEEELDETNASKESSLAEFGDSDLQEVISLHDDCSRRRSKDTKSLSEHRPGVIEEIDSDEFFLREKGLSRGDVHISNYLSSEIRDTFRSNRTRSVEVVNGVNNINNNHVLNNINNTGNGNNGTATPVRPSRTNSLRRPERKRNATDSNQADRFSTMPKSFGGTKTTVPSSNGLENMPENIITSQTFEHSQNSSVLPSTFQVPWRTAGSDRRDVVSHMPPKPPTRQRTFNKFSTFDTRSMIDLSRKRSQSQSGFLPSMIFSETVPKAPLRRSRTSLASSDRDVSATTSSWAVSGNGVPTPPLRRSRMSLTDAGDTQLLVTRTITTTTTTMTKSTVTPPRPPPPGYATVDKSLGASLLAPPQSPVRHRRKKSYEVIKSQEFGAFFTIPRSYSFNRPETVTLPVAVPPSRPARAYNTLGPSRPLRRRLPVREHEYGDVSDGGDAASQATSGRSGDDHDDDGARGKQMLARASSLDDGGSPVTKTTDLCSGDVVEKMKLRPLPSPPPPPRNKPNARTTGDEAPPETSPHHQRRHTDSAVAPFLDQRETSVTSSDDFFADVSRALLASAAKNAVTADDVSVSVQTDPLPDGYELDDLGSCCSAESDRPMSRASPRSVSRQSNAATVTADRPTSRMSMATEYVDRPTSSTGVSATATKVLENGYVLMPDVAAAGVICAQRISVNELQVGKMTVADIRGQRLGVGEMSGSRLNVAHLMAASGIMTVTPDAAAAVMPPPPPTEQTQQDDVLSVHSSRVSSMYPEVDSDEDRASVLAVPTPPRRRSRPVAGGTGTRSSSKNNELDDAVAAAVTDGKLIAAAVDLSAAATDPSITELSCQLFRLCHSNVCSLFNMVVQQVVPEDTEKRRDLQAALCFLSIILAGLLILGFGNEKTIHHHHWDFQFPPPNQ